MHIEEQGVRARATAHADIKVWDTQYCPQSKAFSVFREAICSTFMPWSPEFKSGDHFEGRVEGIHFDEGALARVQMSPLVAVRNSANIANSPLDCFYANYILSGEVKVEQRGRSHDAKRGDLVVYDSSIPVTLTERGGGSRYEDLAFVIPKSRLSWILHAEDHLGNVIFPSEKMIAPLSSTLGFLSQNLLTSSREELQSLFDACVSLLPVAAGCFEKTKGDEGSSPQSGYLMREIMEFVNRNIASTELSPMQAAGHVGISVRYVHKLFAASGTTFGVYVMNRRLDHICRDLVSPACRDQPIFIVAYRWGFNDLSTFIRAFKRRFGCAPSQFRTRG